MWMRRKRNYILGVTFSLLVLGLAFQSALKPPFVSTVAADNCRQTLDVRDFGAVGDGATDDTTAIQAAFDASQPGDCLTFPSTDRHYKITQAIWVESADITVFMQYDQSKIIQETLGQPAFNIRPSANNVTFKDPWLEFNGPERKVAKTSPWPTAPNGREWHRDESNGLARLYSAGFYVRMASNFKISGKAYVSRFVQGVTLRGFGLERIHGAQIDELEVKGVWVGLLPAHVENLAVGEITGSADRLYPEDPEHLVYLAPSAPHNTDHTFGSVAGSTETGSSVFQAKRSRNINVGTITSDGMAATLHSSSGHINEIVVDDRTRAPYDWDGVLTLNRFRGLEDYTPADYSIDELKVTTKYGKRAASVLHGSILQLSRLNYQSIGTRTDCALFSKYADSSIVVGLAEVSYEIDTDSTCEQQGGVVDIRGCLFTDLNCDNTINLLDLLHWRKNLVTGESSTQPAGILGYLSVLRGWLGS